MEEESINKTEEKEEKANIPLEPAEEGEENEKYSFPLSGVIIIGSIFLLMIVCIVVILINR